MTDVDEIENKILKTREVFVSSILVLFLVVGLTLGIIAGHAMFVGWKSSTIDFVAMLYLLISLVFLNSAWIILCKRHILSKQTLNIMAYLLISFTIVSFVTAAVYFISHLAPTV